MSARLPGGARGSTKRNDDSESLFEPRDLVALAALVLSLYLAYETWLTGFRPSFSVGDVIVHSTSVSDDATKPSSHKSFIVPLTVSNSGAWSGTVKELFLTIERIGDGAPRWLYAADIEIDETAYYHQAVTNAPDVLFIRKRFRPFVVRAHDAVEKTFLFGLVRDNAKFPGRATDFSSPGAYRFRLLARLGRDEEFGEAWSQVFQTSDATWKGGRVSIAEYSEVAKRLTPATQNEELVYRSLHRIFVGTVVILLLLAVWPVARRLAARMGRSRK